MTKRLLAVFLSFLSITALAQHRVQLTIGQLPAYHQPGSAVYIAGSFNGWNPADSNYRFQQTAAGNYTLEFSLPAGKHEYKITRGGWDKAECKKNGTASANRLLAFKGDTAISLDIDGWADRFPATPAKSTASRNVRVIDTAFFMKGLNRTRRVWVYLPACYDSCTTRYPVLYMHDGQNLFDDLTSYSGEWEIDEYLDSLSSNANHCIVVAVDHGGTLRLNEYSPYDFDLKGLGALSKSGEGEGAAYVDFLVHTLKPYVDKTYRTAKDRANTAIAGSSMGGLISMYAVLKYPRVFGAAGIFSPAFWIAPRIYDDIDKLAGKVRSRIYFYAGKMEGETMVPGTLKAYEAMSRVSRAEMRTVIRDDGAHNEITWRKEFPLFYEWINRP